MIEMLGVLAIVGVLSVGGLAGYSKMMSQYRINASLEQVAMISSKLSAYGSGANSYEGLTNATALKLGAPVTESNPFGGAIEVKPSKIGENDGDNQAYVITFENLSEEACIALGSSGWGNVRNSSFIGLGVGSGNKKEDIEKALYLGCTEGSDSTYAFACSKTMDIADATLGCTCPQTDCVFTIKFF